MSVCSLKLMRTSWRPATPVSNMCLPHPASHHETTRQGSPFAASDQRCSTSTCISEAACNCWTTSFQAVGPAHNHCVRAGLCRTKHSSQGSDEAGLADAGTALQQRRLGQLQRAQHTHCVARGRRRAEFERRAAIGGAIGAALCKKWRDAPLARRRCFLYTVSCKGNYAP